jgi:malto-oligosyltrehalose trehalohydrolase
MPAALDTRGSLHRMPFGAELLAGGGVRFRIWAPRHERICVRIERAPGSERELPMQSEPHGCHVLMTDAAVAGSHYRFVLPDGTLIPDPASRFQPAGVHGPSEVIDPCSCPWRERSWLGRPWHEAVIYELHVGTFTAAGTFRAAIERLEHLVALGVTAIELMPIGEFPGRRNWGYDGVLPYAPASSYGRPEDLKALIDAAHGHRLMVLLDVVYNHFGPEGNYLSLYAPQFFSTRHHTPWGAAINFDGEGSGPVREFFLHNGLYWLTEYRFDGLRLDAVHAIVDDSPVHLIKEFAQRVRGAVHRPVHLVLENEHNEARWLVRDSHSEPRYFDAQWNDDVHHVLHVAATDEAEGYYGDYRADTEKLARALAHGFAFQGELMPYRGSPRGEPSEQLPPTAFVAFLQNHDQIGNRAFGERLSALSELAALRALTALYLLLPQVPMLFMGEEWHSAQPFQFFCDFGDGLAEQVRNGRRQEFARFAAFRDPEQRARIPDPLSEDTFIRSKLDWDCLSRSDHAQVLEWYRALLAVRQRHIVPLLPDIERGGRYRIIGPAALVVWWRAGGSRELTLRANLTPRPTAGFPQLPGQLLWQEGQVDGDTLSPWSLSWRLEEGSSTP